jgi:hypothetical protein
VVEEAAAEGAAAPVKGMYTGDGCALGILMGRTSTSNFERHAGARPPLFGMLSEARLVPGACSILSRWCWQDLTSARQY